MATWKRLLTEGDISTFTPAGGTDWSGLNGGTSLVTEDIVYDLVQAELDAAAAGTTNTVKVIADNSSISATDALASFEFTGAGPVTTNIVGGATGDPDGIVTITVADATTSTTGIASFQSNFFTVTSGAVKIANTVTFDPGHVTLTSQVSGGNQGDIILDSIRGIHLDIQGGNVISFREDSTTKAVWEFNSDTELALSIGTSNSNDFRFGANGNLTVNNDLTVGGDLIVNGDTTTINTSQLTVEDPLIVLGDQTVTSAVYESTLGGEGGIKVCVGTVDSTPHFSQFIHDESSNYLTGWKAKPSESTESSNTYGPTSTAASSQGNVMVMDFIIDTTPDTSDNGYGIGTILANADQDAQETFFYIRTA